MKTVGDLVQGREVHSVGGDITVREASRFMAEKKIGLVPVTDGEKVIGVFGERDLLKRVVAEGLDPDATLVNDVMTTTMICSPPDETYEQAGSKMIEKGIRHLVVADADQLVGVISLRDLRTHEIDEKSQEIEFLNDYLYFVPPLM
ncbi:cyclic nucleotide-binding/CBS domain-containing protein [Gemmatimonadota bacterium]